MHVSHAHRDSDERAIGLRSGATLLAVAVLGATPHLAHASPFNVEHSCGVAIAFDLEGDDRASDDDPCGPGVWARTTVTDGPATAEILSSHSLGFGAIASGTPTASAYGSVTSEFEVTTDILALAAWSFEAGDGSIELMDLNTQEVLFSTADFAEPSGSEMVQLFVGTPYRVTLFADQQPEVLEADVAFASFAPAPGGAALFGAGALLMRRRRRA